MATNNRRSRSRTRSPAGRPGWRGLLRTIRTRRARGQRCSWARASASRFSRPRRNHFSEMYWSYGMPEGKSIVVDRQQVDPVPFQAFGFVHGGDDHPPAVAVGVKPEVVFAKARGSGACFSRSLPARRSARAGARWGGWRSSGAARRPAYGRWPGRPARKKRSWARVSSTWSMGSSAAPCQRRTTSR